MLECIGTNHFVYPDRTAVGRCAQRNHTMKRPLTEAQENPATAVLRGEDRSVMAERLGS